MKNVITRKLRYPLNLQLFAEGDPDPTIDPPVVTITKPEFTAEQQAEMNRVIAERLSRQQVKFDAEKAATDTEAQRIQLEQKEEYKVLYEKAQAELVRVQGDVKVAQVDALKTQLLVKAGYAADQIARVGKFVSGDDEETLQASIDEIKADIPPKVSGVDPNPGNGKKNEVILQGPEAKVKARFDRLKAQGKI
jgi:hypothetical protein